MNSPILVVMAAGLGSRYGGLKQIDPMGPHGEIIIDYSIFDAVRAGFKKVVFIIKKENHALFEEVIGQRLGNNVERVYVYQEMDDLPEGYAIPEGRAKPWGTGHAVLAARNVVDQPFAVINADDFYGPGAFTALFDYLKDVDPKSGDFCMAGYRVENTLSENGYVARGVCQTENGYLTGIVERTKIAKTEKCAAFTEDDGKTFTDIPAGTFVSMNTWGFTPVLFDELWKRFPAFLDKALETNPLKGEYFLPNVVGDLIGEGKATCKVLDTGERWYGVTYPQDKPVVQAAILGMKDKYPEQLWK